MKKVVVIAVGKIKEKYFVDAIEEYKKRLSRFCKLSIVELCDYADINAVAKESDAILASTDKIDFLTDIEGEPVSSTQLCNQIESVYLSGSDNVVFVIGGSQGINQRVKDKAKRLISFGRVTYPHQLMRVMLLEQIYRCFTISANMPYHK